MLKKLLIAAATLLLTGNLLAADATDKRPHVLLSTSMGDIELELKADKAPISVANFLAYVDSGYYENTIFHRVIPGFMIQGGGFTADMDKKDTQAPIKNEADNGLLNQRGSVAMARTGVVDSATSQFFINSKDNDFLNNGARDFGYAVFATVVNGMDVVDRISDVSTGSKGGMGDVPLKPVMILSAKRL
jgi:peptidyl-prolyl cis-trans isomerase A (cyclophilin A)